MARFLGESYPIGLEQNELAAKVGTARSVAAEMRASGCEMTLLSSTFVPEEEALFCLFEAPSAADVVALGQRAGIQFAHVVEAFDAGSETPTHTRRS